MINIMNHKNKIKITFIIFLISFSLLNFNFINTQVAQAQLAQATNSNYAPLDSLKTVAETNAGYTPVGENSARDITAKIIKSMLSLVGIIFLVLIITSGIQWMMAGGNEETITKAKKKITNATIGLAITMLSYSIVYFVMWRIAMAPYL
jgi:type IV secretion system pilin